MIHGTIPVALDDLTDFRNWVWAVLKAWHGWLGSSALMVVVGLGQSLGYWKPGYRVYIAVLCVGVLFSSFQAWRKEYVAKRNGPQVLMEWDSQDQPWSHDVVRLRNVGPLTALSVKIGNFSWAELSWLRTIEVQSIDPGKEVPYEAQFFQTRPSGHDIGYMWYVLKAPERDPLSIDVTFSDANNTTFNRTFILRRGKDMGPAIMVSLGLLKIKRD